MAGRGHLRVSHADREQVIGTIKAAYVQGMHRLGSSRRALARRRAERDSSGRPRQPGMDDYMMTTAWPRPSSSSTLVVIA
jgi:hypothetical protein